MFVFVVLNDSQAAQKTSVATEPLRTREEPVMRASATPTTSSSDSVSCKNLDPYLNDHLAGSVAALELIEHWREQQKDKPLESFFASLYAEIRADQTVLCDVMRFLGIEESTLRQSGAWAAEKLARARLKIAGDEAGLVLALEGLTMGITGKRMLWRSLAVAELPNASEWNFDQLQRRAEDQIQRIEAERMKAAQRAFAYASRQD